MAWGETSDFVLSTVLRTETGKKGKGMAGRGEKKEKGGGAKMEIKEVGRRGNGKIKGGERGGILANYR